jgi:hypothetical protein
MELLNYMMKLLLDKFVDILLKIGIDFFLNLGT